MLAKGGYLLRRASLVERNGQLARESLALARQSCPASIASVVFSCDRAMQLEAFLRSYREKVAHPGQMYVLFRASDEGHACSYRELRQEMAASSLNGRLTWVEETDFRTQLLDILEHCNCRTVALYVDDMLFLHPVDYDVLKEVDTTLYIPSICRGRDMRYSAVLGRPIDLPDLTSSPYPPLLAFRWNQYRELSDWTYPLGVSGYFYGRDELLALCRRIDFRHPNSLESAMQAYKDVFADRLGLCCEKAACCCVHANRVQTEVANTDLGYFTVTELLERWQKGECIDLRPFDGLSRADAWHLKYTFLPRRRMPAEWEPQAFVQLTWPHEDTDWRDMLPEVTGCFVAMARAILRFEPLLIVCRDAEAVRRLIAAPEDAPLRFCESDSDDTWARDHGGIGRWDGQRLAVCDFGYNAWGAKFPFEKDNGITAALRQAGFFADRDYVDCLDCILEGGSLESDGQGTLLTTESCLLSEHRNDLDKAGAEIMLRDRLGAGRVLWIKHSFLAGDDTDGHIDMLARFCDAVTIAYTAPPESPAPGLNLAPSEWEVEERQRASLQALETELRALRQANGLPYRLIALPCPDPVYEEGERLPASYANFLILNGAVLVPVYRVPQDDAALSCLAEAFPGREIVGIDCRVLIRQHGSLHCSTMQYPASNK